MSDLMGLETPVVLVDLDILERNLRGTMELAKSAGVKLRPHAKTHKSVEIARRQLALGAVGLTVAKLSEAEVMVDGGITDLLVAYPIIGRSKLERLRDLMSRAEIKVSTDDLTVAKGLSDLGEAIGKPVLLYIDVNTGLGRCGREPGEETVRLVKAIDALPGVRVHGLMTHPGQVYGTIDLEEIRRIARYEAESLTMTADMLKKAGIPIEEISIGSTPTSKYIAEQTGVTEMRPGSYVFGDGDHLAMGIITEAECAMTVLATVVSTPRPGTAIIDAGSKTFSSDVNPHRPGYGRAMDNDAIVVERLSEEHGNVRVPDGVRLSVGDRIRFIPNHSCATTNMHDTLYGVRGGRVEQAIRVDARGKVW